MNFSEYVDERDIAFGGDEPDEAAIRAFMGKWKLPLPMSPEAFLPMVHKVRANSVNLPQLIQDRSRVWLLANGYRTEVG